MIICLLNNFIKNNIIFHTLQNNYYGIITSSLESENVEEYLKVNYEENKDPFYIVSPPEI